MFIGNFKPAGDSYTGVIKTLTSHRNTIINGNCVDILPQLPASSINFALTDPPYITRYKSRDGRSAPNDDNDAWLKPAFAEMFRVLAACGTGVRKFAREYFTRASTLPLSLPFRGVRSVAEDRLADRVGKDLGKI
jgi:hypothetical protein